MKHVSARVAGIVTITLAAACTSVVTSPSEELGAGQQASTSCPSNNAARAAADTAYQIMKAASSVCAGNEGAQYGGPCFATDILATHRYTISNGTLVFDANDYQYNYVPKAAKTALAFAQLDSTVASFLVQGQQWAQQNSNGNWLPVLMPIQALSRFTYPGNSTPIPITDNVAGGGRTETVTGSAWCGGSAVHLADNAKYDQFFSPFNIINYNQANETNMKSKFTGYGDFPTSPFNGPGGNSNPFLVIKVQVNGSAVSWNTPSNQWPTYACLNDGSCSGSIDIDPVPYAEPGAYYDTSGFVLGTQTNPFIIAGTLYACADHAGQWGTRTVNGVQEWGTFSTPVTMFGTTQYKYVKQM
ncbi:MAG: hypothetical protein JOZ69_10280 [Myxococcales bacterium]|nr:hypothetical protein [Myxococcales bacterium]